MSPTTIYQATTPQHLTLTRTLFEEYAHWLGIDLSFQGFANELDSLPRSYSAPQGRLLVAFVDDVAAGCVALRPMNADTCEMKRLFVRTNFRGQGIGKQLTNEIVNHARTIGYRTMRLDTLARMRDAIALYMSLGFIRCAPYYDTPLPDTVFMELKL